MNRLRMPVSKGCHVLIPLSDEQFVPSGPNSQIFINPHALCLTHPVATPLAPITSSSPITLLLPPPKLLWPTRATSTMSTAPAVGSASKGLPALAAENAGNVIPAPTATFSDVSDVTNRPQAHLDQHSEPVPGELRRRSNCWLQILR
jgi:hypothetical protein